MKMRISKLMMPALTLAGALALAGCGGGSDTPANPGGGGNGDDDKVACPAPNAKLFVDDLSDCPSPSASGTPLTGDALAEAKAWRNAVGTRLADLSVRGGIIDSASGKKGIPVKSEADPWTASSSVAPSVGGGWAAKGYTRTADDGEENIVSYSIGEQFTSQLLSDWVTGTRANALPDIDDASDDVLTLPTEALNADFFPTGFKAQDLDDGELKGTFVGLAGTFMCSGNECAATRSDDGDAPTITLAGTWTFEPDGTYDRLRVSAKYAEVPNPEFLTFGYWWRETEDDDGDPEVAFDAFADGQVQGAALPGTEAALVSASYSGKASGAYVREVFDGSEKVPAAAGQFTADVTLSAVFNGAATSTVQGSIHDFKDGSTQISDWKLALKVNAVAVDGTFDGTAGSGGTYNGRFFGGSSVDVQTALRATPPVAGGVFNSGTSFDNGQATGAFGATLDED